MQKQQAFSLNSWPALQSLLTIILIAIGGVAWGLKLETRLDNLKDRMYSLEEQTGGGKFPVAIERLNNVATQIEGYQKELSKLNDAVHAIMLELAKRK